MANDPVAPAAAPDTNSAPAPGAANGATPPAAAAAPPAAAAAAPAADAAKTDSTPAAPSLLAGADAAKREGAPADAGKAPDAAKAAAPASAAKPADGTPPPEGPKDPAKPAEAAKPEAGKDGDPKAPEAAAKDALVPQAPPAPPVYADLKLPDGFKLQDDKLKQFDGLLGTFETTAKAEHGQVEALRQNLVDFYHTEVQRIGTEVAKHQIDVWNRLNETRINELKADPVLGGNRIETTLGNAKYALENFMGLSKQEVADVLQVWDNGGVSNHRLTIKALNSLYERFREPEPVPPNPMVPPTKRNEPGQRGWYSAIDGQNLPSG